MNEELELEQIEEEERSITESAIALMLLVLLDINEDITNNLRLFYQKYGKDGKVTLNEARKWVSNKDRRRRINKLFADIQEHFNVNSSNLRKYFTMFGEEVLVRESEYFGIEVPEETMNPKWGQDNLTWSDRLDDDIDLWVAQILATIKLAFVKKEDIEAVVKAIDKKFDSIAKATKRLALTESTAISSSARREIYKQLDIKEYDYYAKLDERTCDSCGGLHGLRFPMSMYEIGVTAPPIHGHCRCFTKPVRE